MSAKSDELKGKLEKELSEAHRHIEAAREDVRQAAESSVKSKADSIKQRASHDMRAIQQKVEQKKSSLQEKWDDFKRTRAADKAAVRADAATDYAVACIAAVEAAADEAQYACLNAIGAQIEADQLAAGA